MTPTLLAITPGDSRDLRPWLDALAGAGLGAVMLREPARGPAEYEALARHVRGLGLQVVLHDAHPAARGLLGPDDLLHLPGGAPPFHGPHTRACHDPVEVDLALLGGATWALWSPVYPPTSKPTDRRATIGAARFLAHAARRPVLALGGIDPTRFAELTAGGAAGCAVLGDLFGRPDPGAAARRLLSYSASMTNSSS